MLYIRDIGLISVQNTPISVPHNWGIEVPDSDTPGIYSYNRKYSRLIFLVSGFTNLHLPSSALLQYFRTAYRNQETYTIQNKHSQTKQYFQYQSV